MRSPERAANLSVRQSTSRIAGLSAAEHEQLQRWFDELERPCAPSREVALVFLICNALSGYMGIEAEILFPAFLSTVRNERVGRESADLA